MSRRHLRIYYVDAHGHEIDRGICSAVMPQFKMPLTHLPASRYTGSAHIHRRELCAMLILHEARHQQFHAVILIACPSRDQAAYRSERRHRHGRLARLVPTNTYLGSFAAMEPIGRVVAGDIMTATLPRAYQQALSRVRDVLARKPGDEMAAGGATR